jgi:hypothetical protein
MRHFHYENSLKLFYNTRVRRWTGPSGPRPISLLWKVNRNGIWQEHMICSAASQKSDPTEGNLVQFGATELK